MNSKYILILGAFIFISVSICLAGINAKPTARSWALATTAILAERNAMRHDTLCGSERTEDSIRKWKEGLSDWWNVNNRKDLLNTLRWIEDGGHRNEFEKMGKDISSMTDDQIKKLLARAELNEEVKHRVLLVQKRYIKLGKKTLIGWDYVRYIMLCRWGYLVGYLSEREAWDRIMPAAQLIQKTFDSWGDLGENYLIGREFWSPELTEKGGRQYVEIHQKLLKDPNSPWNMHPWRVKLH